MGLRVRGTLFDVAGRSVPVLGRVMHNELKSAAEKVPRK